MHSDGAALLPQRLTSHMAHELLQDDGIGLKPREQQSAHAQRLVLQGLHAFPLVQAAFGILRHLHYLTCFLLFSSRTKLIQH